MLVTIFKAIMLVTSLFPWPGFLSSAKKELKAKLLSKQAFNSSQRGSALCWGRSGCPGVRLAFSFYLCMVMGHSWCSLTEVASHHRRDSSYWFLAFGLIWSLSLPWEGGRWVCKTAGKMYYNEAVG